MEAFGWGDRGLCILVHFSTFPLNAFLTLSNLSYKSASFTASKHWNLLIIVWKRYFDGGYAPVYLSQRTPFRTVAPGILRTVMFPLGIIHFMSHIMHWNTKTSGLMGQCWLGMVHLPRVEGPWRP